MKIVFSFLSIAIMLLTTVACNRPIENNDSPHETSSTPPIEAIPNVGNAPNNDYSGKPQNNERESEENNLINISISIGNNDFSATLYDNETSRALLEQLPMTLNMSDLNNNEKFYRLTEDLPFESTERPGTINAGEIMLWSGHTLVLFYETFSNSFGGYVRLGYIEDVPDFVDAVGNANVEITFAIRN